MTMPEGEPEGQQGPDPVQPFASRTNELSVGANGSAGVAPPVLTPSDEENQMRVNAGPHPFAPSGTNMQLVSSGMGSSAADQQRMLMGGAGGVGSFLKTGNGMAADTYQQLRPLMNSSITK